MHRTHWMGKEGVGEVRSTRKSAPDVSIICDAFIVFRPDPIAYSRGRRYGPSVHTPWKWGKECCTSKGTHLDIFDGICQPQTMPVRAVQLLPLRLFVREIHGPSLPRWSCGEARGAKNWCLRDARGSVTVKNKSFLI